MHTTRTVVLVLCLLTGGAAAPGEGRRAVLPDTVLHAASIERVTYRCGQFTITGNLYLPVTTERRVPAVMWVSGSGPSVRTVQRKETIRVINCLLDRGFAYFRIDKPGYGDSGPAVDGDSLFAHLSDVVVAGVRTLARHSAIDPDAIGLFGSSQAGYIMPLAVMKHAPVAFVIGSSCPGESSIDQWKYLLERQMECAGYGAEEARAAAVRFSLLRTTTRKEDFDAAIAYFERHPLNIPALGYDTAFVDRARSWWPRTIDSASASYFDPMQLVEKMHIPLYMVYGALDRQIDPVQAMDAYRRACDRAGNPHLTIVLLDRSDHNMSLSNGCLDEIGRLNAADTYPIDPEYLRTLRMWVSEIAAEHVPRR